MFDISFLNLDSLKTLMAVADTGSFTAAGKALQQTQAGVSMKIKKLEEILGKTLLVRTTRSIELSPEGKIVYSYAFKILALNKEMHTELAGLNKIEILRIGIADHSINHSIASIFARIKQLHPRLKLQVNTGCGNSLLELQQKGELDFVLSHKELGFIPSIILLQENLVWVAPDILNFELQSPLLLALMPSGCQYRKRVLNILDDHKISYELQFESASLTGINMALQGGLAMSVLPESCVPASGVRIIRQDTNLPNLGVLEFCLYGDGSTAIKRSFIKILKTSFTRLTKTNS